MKIKKGDNVQILLGKDRSKTGKVERVSEKKGKVFIPGINVYKRHVGKRVTGAEGGTVEISKPINISNVGLICPSCKQVTRVGFKVSENSKIRVCRKCGKEIGKGE
jgi:large subunit ribosomal protein L24